MGNVGSAARQDGRHALVIGSGFGGLAAAVRLAARGWRVTVLERRDGPGGRANAFLQDGFTFDAGPTVITCPHLLEELWALAGQRLADHVELRPVEPLYRMRFPDGATFDYHTDRQAMRESVRVLSPGDTAGFDSLCQRVERMYEGGIGPLMSAPVPHMLSLAPFAPALVRDEAFRTMYGLVSRHVKDERLRQALSFHPLLIGGSPFTTASAVYASIQFVERRWGAFFPVGGTGALVRGLVTLLESLGGEVRYGSEVTEITVEGRRATGVRLGNGTWLPADAVVSNADAAWTYRYLLPGHVRRHWTDERIHRARYSMSVFLWYFGTRKQYPEVAHHTLLFGRDFKGMFTGLEGPGAPSSDPLLYLHRPTATDAALAPPGHDTFYVLAPVPHLGEGMDWRTRAEPFRRKLQERLARTVLPGLNEALVTSRVFTPEGFRDELRSFRGAAFSFAPTLLQTTFLRAQAQSEDVERLYMVGAGTHPGAGLPAVLCSAKIVDTVIARA
ncbi:phytoene desaturase family protein [Pyxidicoccus parkwayensis]|uniref:phytoene desaturase family protein n=1 Tax=Pyxidicoccus parkwayensis TaxID=2813578 RepID=UPI001F5102EB|nr:phytoene desaturase family protein [Pyxidicoccus parkwaysis]